MKYTLECAMCGGEVTVSKARYKKCLKLKLRPVCRKNGCSQLGYLERADTARKFQVHSVAGVGLQAGLVDGRKTGGRRALLARQRLRRVVTRNLGDGVAEDE